MKHTFALIVASLSVLTAKRLAKESDSNSIENNSESIELTKWITGSVKFDLNGTLRRSLAMHAALADPSRNLVCSPISAILPLGKLVLGTERGKSRDELLTAIGYGKNKVKKRLRSIINKLKYLPGVTLTIASTLYISKNKHLVKKYHSDTMSVFKSTCQKLDFSKPAESAAVINKKVFEGTNGKISEIVSPGDISPSASLILVNAIYFAGRWKEPFQQVYVGNFHTPTGVRKVPMMFRQGNYNYVKSVALGAQILELPYEGDKASFMIVLPKAQNGLALLLRQLKVAPEILNQDISRLREQKVFVTMPKFKIESELNLNVLYEKIGVKHIFLNDKSGLTRITRNEKLWVTKAVQKVYIEVTEKGTEAAAASGIHMAGLSASDRVVFNADRPFLFFIKTEGEQLFAGIFTDN